MPPLRHTNSRRIHHKAWLPFPSSTHPIQHLAVIGAGIAGATVAHQLACSNISVSVFEQDASVANGASGNLAGNCLPIIDQRPNNPYAQWHWLAWQATVEWWQKQPNPNQLGNLTGAAKWSNNSSTLSGWQQWADHYPDEQVQWMHELPLAHRPAGLWFPQGGSLYPRQVVTRLLEHPNIQLFTHTNIQQIQRCSEKWHLISDSSRFEADAIVIASGAQTAHLFPEWGKMLQLNKGQVSHLPVSAWHRPPQFALSYGGYTSPAPNQVVCVGATFEQNAPLGLSSSAHLHNLSLLNQAYPNALKSDTLAVEGHSAYRANTLDHLPLAGPVVETTAYQTAVTHRCHQPDTIADLSSLLMPQVWMSVGHGAHGLTSSFLAAKLIRQQILRQEPELSLTLQQAVHPARAIFRYCCNKK